MERRAARTTGGQGPGDRHPSGRGARLRKGVARAADPAMQGRLPHEGRRFDGRMDRQGRVVENLLQQRGPDDGPRHQRQQGSPPAPPAAQRESQESHHGWTRSVRRPVGADSQDRPWVPRSRAAGATAALGQGPGARHRRSRAPPRRRPHDADLARGAGSSGAPHPTESRNTEPTSTRSERHRKRRRSRRFI